MIAGTPDGTTGGMGTAPGKMYGRWETRLRIPYGDNRYHPVLLLWPDAENWPEGGEIDYAETTASSSSMQFFLHYGKSNNQTQATKNFDITAWHDYAVEWTPAGVTGFIDGQVWFTDFDTTHLPPGPMHPTVQLDWFPAGNSATTPSQMDVAWMRYYPLS